MRLRQSSLRRSARREMAPGPSFSNFPKRVARVGVLKGGFRPCAPGRLFQPGMLSDEGEPTKSKMISSCLWSLSPAKIGLPCIISPKTHPTPQRSIAGVYLRNCNNNSGGLYHLVTTSVV